MCLCAGEGVLDADDFESCRMHRFDHCNGHTFVVDRIDVAGQIIDCHHDSDGYTLHTDEHGAGGHVGVFEQQHGIVPSIDGQEAEAIETIKDA